jgi:hypothetical protein
MKAVILKAFGGGQSCSLPVTEPAALVQLVMDTRAS